MPLKKIADKRLVQEFENELIVYDQDEHKVYHLNAAAAEAWRLCEECNSISELTQKLAKKTGLPADEEVAFLALSELRDAQLIEGSLGGGERVISRRQLNESLGRAAIALPAVVAMLAPTAAMAQSATTTPGGTGTSSPTTTSNTTAPPPTTTLAPPTTPPSPTTTLAPPPPTTTLAPPPTPPPP